MQDIFTVNIAVNLKASLNELWKDFNGVFQWKIEVQKNTIVSVVNMKTLTASVDKKSYFGRENQRTFTLTR